MHSLACRVEPIPGKWDAVEPRDNAPNSKLARVVTANPVPTFAAGAQDWSKTKVTNRIDSRGRAPRLWTEIGCQEPANRGSGYVKVPLNLVAALLLAGASLQLGHARDRGQFASSTPEIKAWFDRLRSGKGPCCSDADGTAISDADWESKDGHYRVRIPLHGYGEDARSGELIWVDVPEDAVISEPNRVGRTMVWPIYGYLGVRIRCFMPGSMT